jgi:hypothetical protein
MMLATRTEEPQMNKRFGKARVPGCRCETNFTCGPCLAAAASCAPARNPLYRETLPETINGCHAGTYEWYDRFADAQAAAVPGSVPQQTSPGLWRALVDTRIVLDDLDASMVAQGLPYTATDLAMLRKGHHPYSYLALESAAFQAKLEREAFSEKLQALCRHSDPGDFGYMRAILATPREFAGRKATMACLGMSASEANRAMFEAVAQGPRKGLTGPMMD